MLLSGGLLLLSWQIAVYSACPVGTNRNALSGDKRFIADITLDR
jgi:hypothetical protein